MKLTVKKDTCIGCGACTNIADEVFSFDDEGLAEANNSKINEENMEDVLTAIDNCPVEAIVKEEKNN